MAQTSDASPTLAPADYAQRFTEPCVLVPDYKMKSWYLGTGIAPSAHPLRNTIEFGPCDHCQSPQVLIIAAQSVVHPYSGDLYWDYESVCTVCGKFTVRSYAEN